MTAEQTKIFFNRFPNVGSHLLSVIDVGGHMKISQAILLISATALSALAFSGSAATAGPIVPRGHYCLALDLGGSDCNFASYQQCLATAQAYEAQCYGKTARDDQRDRTRILRW